MAARMVVHSSTVPLSACQAVECHEAFRGETPFYPRGRWSHSSIRDARALSGSGNRDLTWWTTGHTAQSYACRQGLNFPGGRVRIPELSCPSVRALNRDVVGLPVSRWMLQKEEPGAGRARPPRRTQSFLWGFSMLRIGSATQTPGRGKRMRGCHRSGPLTQAYRP